MNKNKNNFNLWIFIIVGLMAMFFVSQFTETTTQKSKEIGYSEFWASMDAGQVSKVTLTGNEISALIDGQEKITYLPQGERDFYSKVKEAGKDVEFVSHPPRERGFLSTMLTLWVPTILIFGFFWWFLSRQMGGGRGGVMGFGKSKAKMLEQTQKKVTFDDVAGVDEAQEELYEIVDFLKNPKKFQQLGGSIPKGCLLVGPPGTGKTLLARAVAGEAGVPFFSISGSDFVEMFVGVGASRVRDMFEQGKKNAPCIIFIDEIDAVGRHRGAGLGGGNDEREQTLNQILVEMDGFDSNEGVILIAATNRPDVLDPALLRPGRFDRQITVPRPDVLGREKILQVHMRKAPLAENVSARTLARGTPGFSGAELANLVNEAALLAARENKKVVSMADFEKARDKVLMGPERKSLAMIEEERVLTAWHEAGHAIVQLNVADMDPLHKVTIIPRGRALGVTMSLPEKEYLSMNRIRCKSRLAMTFGGRVAEELALGHDKVTSGAMGDIQQATGLARAMVTEWGFSEKLGPVRYSSNEQEVFLGHSVAQQKNMSEATANLIDEEVHRIVTEGLEDARRILNEKFEDLRKLTEGLLEYETLSGTQVNALLSGDAVEAEALGASFKEGDIKETSVPETIGFDPTIPSVQETSENIDFEAPENGTTH
ncbi:MAG: ATP-dependent zinc metalloprotease FtsH [Alphaproteobacteria bacterium]